MEVKQQHDQEEEEHVEEDDVFHEDGLAPLPRGGQSLSPFSADGKPEGGGGGRRGRKISLFNVNEQVRRLFFLYKKHFIRNLYPSLKKLLKKEETF